MPEEKLAYHWRVWLRDGTVVNQYNEDGTTNKWPRERINDIKRMIWNPVDKTQGLLSHDRIVLDGEKPVQFMRTKEPVGKPPFRVYVIGVEKEDDYGEIERDLLFISTPFKVTINWPGSVQRTNEPKFKSAFEEFVDKNVCLFEE